MKTVSIYRNIDSDRNPGGCTILIHADGVAAGYTSTLTVQDAYTAVRTKYHDWNHARGLTKLAGSAEQAQEFDRVYTRRNQQPIYTTALD